MFMIIGVVFAAILTIIDMIIMSCPKSDKFLLFANFICIGAMLIIFSYGLKLHIKSKKVARKRKRRR